VIETASGAIQYSVSVLLCAITVAPAECWPKNAVMTFEMQDNECGAFGTNQRTAVLRAVKRRRTDLRGRYAMERNISCAPGRRRLATRRGLPPDSCRDIGTADGHCNSPLLANGTCPN
jgi:hypothetical protein